MFLNSLINYCNSLQTQNKVAMAGAAAICSAALVYLYYANKCDNDAGTNVVLHEDNRKKQSTEVLSNDKSVDNIPIVKPKEGGQLCLINPSIELCLDTSTISRIRALQLRRRSNNASANGRNIANELVCAEFYWPQHERSETVLQVKEQVCAEFYWRQHERSELVLPVKEHVCVEFCSRQQIKCDGRSLLNVKQLAGFGGKVDVEKVGLELVKFSSDLYPTFGRCDWSEKVDKTSRDVTEQQLVPEEDEILFIDASAWCDQEVDDEIDFLTWLQSVEEGKRVHVESKVNLNRQRERLSRAREAEVRRLYENCKDNAYDYNSQWKTSAGGVRYGHSTFSVAEEEPYKYKPEDFEALLANRKRQYVFLDDDDIIDVTDRPDLQEQFLKGEDKPAQSPYDESQNELHSRLSDDRDFGYLDELLDDYKESQCSEPQKQNDNDGTGFGFQGTGCFQEDESRDFAYLDDLLNTEDEEGTGCFQEDDSRDFAYLDDLLNTEDEEVDEEGSSSFPRDTPPVSDGHPSPQWDTSRPQWTAFGASHLDPLLSSHWEQTGGFNIPNASYESLSQRQSHGYEFFTGNGEPSGRCNGSPLQQQSPGYESYTRNGEPSGGYSIHDQSYESLLQQQSPMYESFSGNSESSGGYTIPGSKFNSRPDGWRWRQQSPGYESFAGSEVFFSRPTEFNQTAPGLQWPPTEHGTGDAFPRDY